MKYKCTKCGIEINRNGFYKDSHQLSGYRPDCKKCNNKSSLSWSKKNTEKRRFNVMKSATGVNKEQYLSLLELQHETCAICNATVEDNNRNLCIDHCHDSDLVRGLLCTRCNFGLGYFKDDKELLNKAIIYLDSNFSYKGIKYIEAKSKRNNERKVKKEKRKSERAE